MLESKQADFIPSIWNFDVAEDLMKNPDFNVFKSTKGTTQAYYLFFNCRRGPFNNIEIRKAVAHLVNRKYICETLLKGWAEPLETFVPPLLSEWTNLNATAPEFSTVKAIRILDSLGYELDNSTGKRIDPNTRDYIMVLVLTPNRSEDPHAWVIGYTIVYYLNAIGLNSSQIELSDYFLREKTMKERDFDICILETTLARTPFGLYAYFHSSRDVNWTYAYSGIKDFELDYDLERLWFGIEESEVIEASRMAQLRLSSLVPCVPVCSIYKVSAINSKWVGTVNMPGYGVENPATYLNIRFIKEDFGGQLVQTLLGGVSTLNPCVAKGKNEWKILQLIYSPLIAINPETMEDTPFIAEKWDTEPWVMENGINGMKITFTLNKNVTWHDGYPFTSEDVKFCIEYLKKKQVPRYNKICEKIVEVKTPNEKIIEIYLNETGYRFLYEFAWMTFMPKHIWKDVEDYISFKPWNETHPENKELTKLIGQSPFILKQYVTGDSVELVWNPTFFLKNPDKPVLVEQLTSSHSAIYGENITIRYRVLSHTRTEIHEKDTAFIFQVKSNNETLVFEEKPILKDNIYEIIINTEKIGLGNYFCEFKALPYGIDNFTLTIKQTRPSTNVPILFNTIFIVGIVTITGIIALIVLKYKK